MPPVAFTQASSASWIACVESRSPVLSAPYSVASAVQRIWSSDAMPGDGAMTRAFSSGSAAAIAATNATRMANARLMQSRPHYGLAAISNTSSPPATMSAWRSLKPLTGLPLSVTDFTYLFSFERFLAMT